MIADSSDRNASPALAAQREGEVSGEPRRPPFRGRPNGATNSLRSTETEWIPASAGMT